MKRSSRNVANLVVLILLFIPAMEAAGSPKVTPPSDYLNVWQARRVAIAGLMATNHYYGGLRIGSYRFTLDSLEIDTTGHEHFKIDLKSLPPVFVHEGIGVRCYLKDDTGKSLPAPLNKWAVDCANGPGQGELVAVAQSFADAINRLRAFAGIAGDTLRAFPQQAAAWRALASKPPVPENVRLQRLLAEDAIKEEKPEEALKRYEAGLELYPTWPQGYFNAALVAAELGFYPEAIEHMQSYLELVPDAADAQAARDQIAIWQFKASQPAPAPK